MILTFKLSYIKFISNFIILLFIDIWILFGLFLGTRVSIEQAFTVLLRRNKTLIVLIVYKIGLIVLPKS